MLRVLSRIVFGAFTLCLLITLIAPSSSVTPYAMIVVVAGIVTLVICAVLELIYVFMMIRPSSNWKPGNPDQAEGRLHRNDEGCVDDLVDGTAMDLIDWDG